MTRNKEKVIKENQEFFSTLPLSSKNDRIMFCPIGVYILKMPHSMTHKTDTLIDAVTGGCGPGGFGDKFIPDTLWGLNVKLACKIHDWTFQVWNDAESFVVANDLFHENMLRIIKQHGGNRFIQFLRRSRAKKYYLAVAALGLRSYLDNHLKYILGED